MDSPSSLDTTFVRYPKSSSFDEFSDSRDWRKTQYSSKGLSNRSTVRFKVYFSREEEKEKQRF